MSKHRTVNVRKKAKRTVKKTVGKSLARKGIKMGVKNVLSSKRRRV